MSLTSLLALIILLSTVLDASNIPLTIESFISYPTFLNELVISLPKLLNLFLASSVILTISFLIEFDCKIKLFEILLLSDTETIEKNFILIDDDYLKWDNDNYLYSYINNNIERIFNN